MERQAAWENRRGLFARADFEVIGRHGPIVGCGIRQAVDAAHENGAFIAPGKASAEIGVPGVSLRRRNGFDLDTHSQKRPTEPRSKTLAKRGEDLAMVLDKRPLTDDFT